MPSDPDPEPKVSAHATHAARSADGSIPVAPSLNPALDAVQIPPTTPAFSRRTLVICAYACALGLLAAGAAQVLTALIAFCTNVAFFGRFNFHFTNPATHQLGLWVIPIPIVGGIIVGLMARYGSAAIRGHGIPEAMENILVKESRIPARLTLLKPLSAAVAIGTGGPFGAEGPIIATGGAMGSLLGQVLHTTADERKTLLAAGAAAGMAATFGTPLAAVVLAIELLLFEFRPRSIVPVALASVVAAAVRAGTLGSGPVFPMAAPHPFTLKALTFYAALGLLLGLVAVGVTRLVYAIEDAFDRLPLHWMWWPALGGIAVGVVGYFNPATLGVGYLNLDRMLAGEVLGAAAISLGIMKLISWSLALGSGTSGGTLAPLFTIGGALGCWLGGAAMQWWPLAGIDVRMAALIGMLGLFADASRALLASILFALETTQQPLILIPLIIGVTLAYIVSTLLIRRSIMTEKIERRGVRVPSEYSSDALDPIKVGPIASRPVVTLRAHERLGAVRQWIDAGTTDARHQGYPVVDHAGNLLGVLTRRDLLDPQQGNELQIGRLLRRPPVVIHEDDSLAAARDQFVRSSVGRLPVVLRDDPRRVVAILTRSDLLAAYQPALQANHERRRVLPWRPAKPSEAL